MEMSRPTDWTRPWRWPAHAQVALAIAIGAGLGTISGITGASAARYDLIIYDLLGTVFMNALKMLVVPLIASALIAAILDLGRLDGLARMGGKILLYYLGTGLIAILVGVALVHLVQPGVGAGLSADQVHQAVSTAGSSEAGHLAEITAKSAGRSGTSFLDVFKDLFPPNLIDAAAKGQTLGIIVFSVFFGVVALRLGDAQRQALASFWQSTYAVILGIAGVIILVLPIGVCALIAKTTTDTVASGQVGERLTQLAKFTGVVLAGLAIHSLVVVPLVLALIARVNPLRHFRAVGPALLAAFSTSSSNATLPLTLDCLRRAGVSTRVTSVVVPVGANVNSDGTALYECVVVLFLAQFYGIHLGLAEQLTVVLYALATSVGVAGIPSASLVAIVVIINAVNARIAPQSIPVEGMAVILVVDRLLDMCRTVVNVLGDTTCAVVVARSEGEDGVLAGQTGR